MAARGSRDPSSRTRRAKPPRERFHRRVVNPLGCGTAGAWTIKSAERVSLRECAHKRDELGNFLVRQHIAKRLHFLFSLAVLPPEFDPLERVLVGQLRLVILVRQVLRARAASQPRLAFAIRSMAFLAILLVI